ncbi:MAG TPA: hypothetical protein VMV27_08660 [Candidatus Binataceae bacterium]|nr:hypothetical protein [Candidatus Binataceae bacterium]
MRYGRIVAGLVIATFAMVLISAPHGPGSEVWAQIVNGPPPPLPLPPPAPGAAVSPAALPSLLGVAPSPLAGFATPTPVLHRYQCSCYGPGTSPRWMGNVAGADHFQARQAAVNSCVAYNFNRRPGSAYIPPQRFAFFPTPAPPLGSSEAEPGLPNLTAPGVSGFSLLNSPRAIILRLCSQCACN